MSLLTALQMTQFLYRRLQEHGWLQQDRKAEVLGSLGIVMRVDQDDDIKFITEPQTVDDKLKLICGTLNLGALFTMSSDLTQLFFSRIAKDDSELTLSPNKITVPVVYSLEDIARDGAGVRRRDFCCFVRRERVVLVWSNSGDELMLHGSEVDSKLMSSVKPLCLLSPLFYLTILRSGAPKFTKPHRLRITADILRSHLLLASNKHPASLRAAASPIHSTETRISLLSTRLTSGLKMRNP